MRSKISSSVHLGSSGSYNLSNIIIKSPFDDQVCWRSHNLIHAFKLINIEYYMSRLLFPVSRTRVRFGRFITRGALAPRVINLPNLTRGLDKGNNRREHVIIYLSHILSNKLKKTHKTKTKIFNFHCTCTWRHPYMQRNGSDHESDTRAFSIQLRSMFITFSRQIVISLVR